MAITVCILAFFVLNSMERRDQKTSLLEESDHTKKSNLWVKIKSLEKTGAILFISFLSGLCCMPFQTYLSSFLIEEQGASINESAVVWRLIGIAGMIGGFAMGWVADRITVRWTLTLVCFLLSSSNAMLLFFDMNVMGLYDLSVLFGLAFSIFGLIPAYISHAYKSGTAALVNAFSNASIGFGAAFGNVLGGWMKNGYDTFSGTYIVALAAAVGAILICLLMRGENDLLLWQ